VTQRNKNRGYAETVAAVKASGYSENFLSRRAKRRSEYLATDPEARVRFPALKN
jgi:hypothetical protein